MLTRQISVSEQTVKRLKALAEPLDDTYDSLISRLLDAYGDRSSERGKDTAAPASMPSESGSRARLRRYAERSGDTHVLNILGVGEPRERRFDPLVPPNLTHTKITSASFDGRPLIPASWNGLLDEAVRTAKRKLRIYAEVRKICHMNIVEGQKADEGYHFIREAGVSVQGQDANDAWRRTAHIARQIGSTVDVHFSWRLKEGAVYPGSNGHLQIAGAR